MNQDDVSSKSIYLGEKDPKHSKTIIFDLDETLIHCNESLNIPYDIALPITFPSGETV